MERRGEKGQERKKLARENGEKKNSVNQPNKKNCSTTSFNNFLLFVSLY
jgi:hypothetical protein